MWHRFFSFRSVSRAVRISLIFGVLLAGSFSMGWAQQAPASSAGDTTEVTFDEAVRIALDQNTDLKRAQADARQSNTEVQSEWMDFAPDLNVSTDVTRRFGRNFSQVTGSFTTRSTDFFNLTGRSSITLFNGFENVASLRRANNQARAREVDVQRTQREVAFTVMDQFIALVESREQVRVRREQLDALRQQLQQTEEFVDAGASPVSDLYQQQADVADAEQQLLQAQREREVSKTRLIQTLQLNPQGTYDFQVPDLEEDTEVADTYDRSALIEEAFQNRLDLEVAASEKRAAEHNVRAAHSSYYPSLSLSGNYGSRWTSRPQPLPVEGTSQPPKVAEVNPVNGDGPVQFNIPGTGGVETREPSFYDQVDNNRSGSISLSLSFSIFDRFQRNTQVEQAQVQAQNAEYALQDQRQQVALEVRQAHLDYKNAVQQLEAANKRLKAAEQAQTATQERYNLGSASIVELRNANRDYVDAASQQIRARYNLLFQQKQIEYHVGRLDPRQPLRSVRTDQ
jgi:outer membrane protein